MRNLKKILALVLAMVMTFSVMATANAFTDDAQIDDTYAEAVEVLSALKVFKGNPDGSFAPDANITRAEVAAIVYRIVTTDVADKNIALYADYNKFDDVKSTAWYAGYVNYCANAELVRGKSATTFDPNGNVTGYEALAMILRAIGYDKNAEFTGKDWQVKVASTAEQNGITKTLKGVALGQAASREVVAEILFRTLTVAEQKIWTPALSYYLAKAETLGEENFGLENKGVSEDVWGRPGNLWYANGKKLVLVAYDAVASYIVKVDECDIAKDMGLTKKTAIESLWIDGIVANAQNDGYVNPYSTTKNVGAQGRLTEVYDMGKDGVRIVEINTYLALTTAVKATSTDKNGHVTDGYATFTVYGVDSGLTFETEDFVLGQYALVTVSNPGTADEAIESAVATAPTTVGYTTDWDTTTTTIGKTEYTDADKFVLNKNTVKSAEEICWDVFVDQYGNIIGAVKTASNYMVIEKIEWKHTASTIGEGYALANVILANGEKLANVTIAEVNGEDVTNSDYYDGSASGYYGIATVADSFVNNKDYYDHIWTYTVDENGAYSIVEHDAEGSIADYKNVEVVNGQATIGTYTNNVVATSTTVFLVENVDAPYTYDVYVGKANVPSGTAADMCVLTDDNGYATLVVLNGWIPAGNTFLAYVNDVEADGNSATLGEKHKVYKVGETTATIVYDNADVLAKAIEAHNTGLYTIELNNKGQVVSAKAVICDLHCADSWAGATVDGVEYDRVMVEGKENNTSFSTEHYAGLTAKDTTDGNDYAPTTTGGAHLDFNVLEDTKIIKVTKDGFTGDAKLAAGTMSDVVVGDVVIVAYTTRGNNINDAKVVYVLTNTYTAPKADTYAWDYVGATMDAQDGAQIEIQLLKNDERKPLSNAGNLDVTVTVYNKAGTQVYSTTVEAEVDANGNLLVTAPHTLTAGAEYMAEVVIDGSVYFDDAQTVETPYIEAQTTAGVTDTETDTESK